MPFDLKDLKSLLVMASSGLLVGAHPSVGAKSLADLVAKTKAEPMLFSSGSNGSPGHLAVSILVESTGAKIAHVPYKDTSPAVKEVLTGEVKAGVLATPRIMLHVPAALAAGVVRSNRGRGRCQGTGGRSPVPARWCRLRHRSR